MRVAALYDVHGNLPALEAVMAEVEREAPDVVLVGGDVCAGPFPRECLALLRALGDRAVWIRGNAEREPGEWVAGRLPDEELTWLVGLPLSVVLGSVLYCHGSPRFDDEILTARSPESRLEAALAGLEQRVIVHGHTHVQYDRAFGEYRLIGPGSVGMPYADAPGAYWGLFGPDYEPRHTEYDLEAAAERIRASGWPGAAEFAAENLLTVPTAEEAIEVLETRAASR